MNKRVSFSLILTLALALVFSGCDSETAAEKEARQCKECKEFHSFIEDILLHEEYISFQVPETTISFILSEKDDVSLQEAQEYVELVQLVWKFFDDDKLVAQVFKEDLALAVRHPGQHFIFLVDRKDVPSILRRTREVSGWTTFPRAHIDVDAVSLVSLSDKPYEREDLPVEVDKQTCFIQAICLAHTMSLEENDGISGDTIDAICNIFKLNAGLAIWGGDPGGKDPWEYIRWAGEKGWPIKEVRVRVILPVWEYFGDGN